MANASGITAVQEIERKYEMGDDLCLPDAGELLGAKVDPAETQVLDAVYFDTPDFRLIRAGVTLRRRVGGADAGWHLKLPVGGDHREELRLPLTRAGQRPPAELAALVRVYSRGADLDAVVEMCTHRRTWVRTDGGGRPMVELADDQVVARTLGTQPSTRSWQEIEVELGEAGTSALLEEIEHQMLAAGLHRSTARSKLGRVLAERAPVDPPEPEFGTRPTAGEVVHGYLHRQVHELRRYDPMVRRDSADAVHQMRVAARRMRSGLQAFGRVLDRDRTSELIEDLAWIAGELAPARDTEVMAEHFSALLDELPEELVLGPVEASITRNFARRQVGAREQTLAALNSDRYLAMLDRIDALVANPPLTVRATRPARTELPRSVARVYKRLDARMTAVWQTPAGPGRDEALHETRKAAKRLRYAAEAVAPVIGAPARRLQQRLVTVHDLLGTHQDTAVSRPVLRELAIAAHVDGDNGFTYGLLHATETTRAASAEGKLPRAWKQLQRGSNVRWLRH
jgi:CHAD domain-containing protein